MHLFPTEGLDIILFDRTLQMITNKTEREKAFFVLMLFALFEKTISGFVVISMPALRVAGGILLLLTAVDILFQRRTKRSEDQSENDSDDPSVFPLSIRLLRISEVHHHDYSDRRRNARPHWFGLG